MVDILYRPTGSPIVSQYNYQEMAFRSDGGDFVFLYCIPYETETTALGIRY